MAWTPFGVKLEISASAGTVTRISATQFTVKITASWETYYTGAMTNYGMTASSGGGSVTLNEFGNRAGSGSGSFTGTYSISGNASATKTITVTFRNFNGDTTASKTTTVNLSVNVPALPSYTIKYDANGGSGAPSAQTKWKDQLLTLSFTKPTRTGYFFSGWSTSPSGHVSYLDGAVYSANASVTLYAVWVAKTYNVSYDANGGSGAPGLQIKTHGVSLTLSSTKPTRTNYTFKGWGTSASATTVSYAAGGSYTTNAAVTLYAIWELAYTKPRITNFSVKRCDASGTVKDDGAYALVSFTWACDKDIAQILIEWKLATAATYTSSFTVTATGKSGTVSQVIGSGSLAVTSSYTIRATVKDSGDSTVNTRTLNSLSFTLHGKPGGDGIAFGKTAELGADESMGGSGVAEFAFDAKFNQPVYGNVLGLNKLPAIPANSELNDYMDTGCWAIQSNAIAATITCGGVLLGTNDTVPPARAGRLEVYSSTGEGIRAAQWSYLRQRIMPYNDANPIYERDIARGDDNVWRYYDWWKSNLTPAAAKKVYSKAAITISRTANIALGTVNTYTKIPFTSVRVSINDRLKLGAEGIQIGADIDYVKVSGQVLVKCGTVTGNRHARIQKVSGGTTTSWAWNCLYCTASSNSVLTIAPIIIPVAEGDILTMVYYTSDSADAIQSGSTANGLQTYFTAEEI